MTLRATVSRIFVSQTENYLQTRPRDSHGFLRVHPLTTRFEEATARRRYAHTIIAQQAPLRILLRPLCAAAIAL